MVETNLEIGRVYSRKTMSEEGFIGLEPQFIESFLAINYMVEEMYRDFRKHKDEDSSGSKQDKGGDESHSHDHSKGKGKEESFLTPPDSPKNKTSLIKLDVKFNLPIYDGELNAKKLDNWIRQIDVYYRVQSIESDKSKIQLASLHLGGTALVWWEGRTQADMKRHGKTISV